MFHLILYEPEIAPNTGNIIRLCANTGAQLHLIHPLGFSIDDRRLRRAGLDYHDLARVTEHHSLADFTDALDPERLFACSTKGMRGYAEPAFEAGDGFLFGPETRGLPPFVLESFADDQVLRIPMGKTSRSLNLSNAAAIVLYEAWRQLGFAGGT
jgi:tRNA (cytidine/uridine-2'-O-)-methyltransferase